MFSSDENTVNTSGAVANCEKTPKPADPLPRPEEDDVIEEDQEEKARLISQVLELQNTLDGMCRDRQL